MTIAIISIVGGVLQLLSGNVGSILSGIVVIAAGSFVIYADRKEKAWAYIPYLVLQVGKKSHYKTTILLASVTLVLTWHEAKTVQMGLAVLQKTMGRYP